MFSVIAYDGQVYGPVDIRTLISWCQQGRVVASTHLVETQTGRSFLAADMPELAAVLAQGQAPNQPPSPQPNPQTYGNPQQPGGFQVSQQPYNPQQPQNPYAPYVRPGSYAPPQYQGQFPSSPATFGQYGQPKSRATALIWCGLFGPLGAHRFYLGHRTSAIVMLVVGLLSLGSCYMLVISLLWTGIDFIRIASGSMADAQGVVPR